ncbi:mitochondrial intermembrane space import and assembly protein 40-B [Galendromus occidentalis]|uniref:Mitochondrial intermembrane space import and assembly protein 40-B n=1 Tax=Galendromus occidentalis TaxID=34638 RepID=A0AAJ6QY26_9ACAR|nr:mitochondrial intermembrane space import and assembly protein 40-B [Galendromus occidentalis]
MADGETKEFDFGKDHVILMTDADASAESKYKLPERDVDDNEPRGLIQPDGQINWECPCLGGIALGPCGFEFREAFACMQRASGEEEPKGMECVEAFRTMRECMSKYPALYDRYIGDDDDDAAAAEAAEADVNTIDDQRATTDVDQGGEVGSDSSSKKSISSIK